MVYSQPLAVRLAVQLARAGLVHPAARCGSGQPVTRCIPRPPAQVHLQPPLARAGLVHPAAHCRGGQPVTRCIPPPHAHAQRGGACCGGGPCLDRQWAHAAGWGLLWWRAMSGPAVGPRAAAAAPVRQLQKVLGGGDAVDQRAQLPRLQVLLQHRGQRLAQLGCDAAAGAGPIVRTVPRRRRWRGRPAWEAMQRGHLGATPGRTQHTPAPRMHAAQLMVRLTTSAPSSPCVSGHAGGIAGRARSSPAPSSPGWPGIDDPRRGSQMSPRRSRPPRGVESADCPAALATAPVSPASADPGVPRSQSSCRSPPACQLQPTLDPLDRGVAGQERARRGTEKELAHPPRCSSTSSCRPSPTVHVAMRGIAPHGPRCERGARHDARRTPRCPHHAGQRTLPMCASQRGVAGVALACQQLPSTAYRRWRGAE